MLAATICLYVITYKNKQNCVCVQDVIQFAREYISKLTLESILVFNNARPSRSCLEIIYLSNFKPLQNLHIYILVNIVTQDGIRRIIFMK